LGNAPKNRTRASVESAGTAFYSSNKHFNRSGIGNFGASPLADHRSMLRDDAV
jgi:hypothetical protein